MIYNACRLISPVFLVLVLGSIMFVSGCSQDDSAPAVEPRTAVSDRGNPSADSETEAAAADPATEPPGVPVNGSAPVAEFAAAVDPADPLATAVPATEPAQHEVRGVVTQWQPMILFVQPGDTVVFRQMTGHDTESMEGLFPARATPWKSQLGQEAFNIKLDVPGAYLYKCNPHVSTGMIGAIVVGERPPANLAELEASPQNKGMTGRAIRKLKEALNQ